MKEKINNNINSVNYKNWFFFSLLYLIVDYIRPQDILPIGSIKPGMIIIIILTGFLIINGNLRDVRSKQTSLLLLFIMLLAAYVPFARNNYYAYLATKDMVLYLPFILSIVICINSIERLKKLIFIIVLSIIFVSGYSLLHHGVGAGNYFEDENDLSLFINMWLPFCFFLMSIEKKKYRKNIYGIGLIIGVLGVIMSFSRGGFIGLLSIAVVALLFSPHKMKSLFVICILSILFNLYATDIRSDISRKGGKTYWEEMSTTTDTTGGTAAARIESWKAGWYMFLDKPWGVGGYNFPVWFPEYQTEYFKRSMWGRAAHSLWFTLLPETGVFGVIIFLLLLYHNVKDIFFLRRIKNIDIDGLKYFHALSAAFIASIVGYLSSGSFLSVLYYPHYWYLTGILVATVKVGKMAVKANEIANSDRMQ